MAKRGYDVPGPWDKRYDSKSNIVEGIDWNKLLDEEEEALKKLWKESDAALAKGTLVGVIVHFGIADGWALYRVEKLKPLTLAHIPAHDAYQIPAAHLRGLTLQDIKQMVDWEKFNTHRRER